jgi:soluble lytic murein transglycosylase
MASAPSLLAAWLTFAILLAWLPSALALDAAGRDNARKALLGADAGKWDWAAAMARRSGEPLIAAYVRWVRLRDGQGAPSFAAYRDFLAAHPGWPSEGRLQANAETAMPEATPAAERLTFFDGRSPVSREGRLRLAEALLATKRRNEAAAILRRSWVEDDFSRVDENYFLGLYGNELTRADHVARLERLLWDRSVDAARRMLPLVDGDRRALANARIQLQQSAPGVDGAVRAVPASLRGDAGLAFDRLRWRRLKGRDADAREILLNPPARLVRPNLWWGERAILARQAIDAKQFKIAYRLLNGHGLSEGAGFAEAEWLAGWLALRFVDDPATALGHFQRLADGVRTPISRARGTYWAGRAAAALDRAGEARRWYAAASGFPTTYYGQLAAGELGLRLTAQAAASGAAADDGRVARLETARMLRLLCELGEYERAVPFVTKLAGDAQGDAVAVDGVLRLATACGRAHIAVRAAKGVTRDREPDIRASHPVPRVRSLAGRQLHDPDAALRLAVARQESLFDPEAKSRAGALGLMQLMPATARAMAKALGLKHDPGRLTRDPEYNAQLGSAYLQRQIRRFDGEVVLALAAYNAGPARAARWIEQLGDPRRRDAYGLIDWVELIPFAETRNYVQRVLESRAVYELVLAAPDAGAIVAVADNRQREALNEQPPPSDTGG